jgi:hypothetical protein
MRVALRFREKLPGILAPGGGGHQKGRHRFCGRGQSIPP